MPRPDDDRRAIEDALRRHVDRLAGLIGPRSVAHPGSLDAAIGYITQQWEAADWDVAREEYEARNHPAANLVVERAGTRQPDRIVLLGAHYDTVDGSPGADDNASAVAVLLEVSRLLAAHDGRRTARYVAFAFEEAPYFNLGAMGSQHHARMARGRDERIDAMLCLEMVGYFTDEPGSQRLPPGIPRPLRRLFPKRGDFLAAVGNPASWRLCWSFRRGFKRGSQMPLFSVVLPESIDEIRRSDNSSFWDQGYPALMLTDTSFLRNANYHQPTDTPDTLDYARMVDVTLGVAAAMRHLLG